MRSRLAARSTRLVLAAATLTALAASTACSAEDATGTDASAAPSSTSSASSASAGGKSETPADGSTTHGNSLSANGSTGDEGKSGDDDKSGYGQSCGTNDLDFTITWEAQPISYYLVTAKAKSGITCYLDVNTPSVSFGSRADGVASPVGQGGEDPVKLSGSSVAYTGINVKTTEGEGGTQFEFVTIATSEDDPNPAEVELPDAPTVNKPIVTNWSTKRNEVVPHLV
ncbi:hypothetical protein OHB07_01280 [Streptomyces sp. NBC_00111]|uniref:hypothetical protein n=1 Tax=unclassified Streptomyces TaxID=2593676 RepID=UPI002E347C6D|nr:hypothetical protein [Streptomyces sp. NBC_01460]